MCRPIIIGVISVRLTALCDYWVDFMPSSLLFPLVCNTNFVLDKEAYYMTQNIEKNVYF